MGSLPPNHIFGIANCPVDHDYLHRVFSHRDGLSTARSLVETMLRNDAQRSARGVNSAQSQSAVAFALNSANPTMPAALREVLALSDDAQPPKGGDASASTSGLETNEAPDQSHVAISSRPYPTSHTSSSSSSSSTQPRQTLQPVSVLSTFAQKQLAAGCATTMPSPMEIDGFHPINPRPAASNQRPQYQARPLAPYPQAQAPQAQLHREPTPKSKSSTPKPVKIAPKKRKVDEEIADTSEKPIMKRPRARKAMSERKKADKPSRESQPKAANEKRKCKPLDDNLWMRILEFTGVADIPKARLISQQHKRVIDSFDSILINQRLENYGEAMPPPLPGMTEKQYANLLGSHKGCEDCENKKASRTHWSWQKRWCQRCWKLKLEREDRIFKSRSHQYSRTVLVKLLECIPAGMHDSFMKPHDYVANIEAHSRSPRLYTYYLLSDLDNIISLYEDLTPAPYVEDPTQSAEEKVAAAAAHQELMDGLEGRRDEFLAAHKAKTDEMMKWVQGVEAGIRTRRFLNGLPNEKNRQARRDLFTRRAKEDLFALYRGMDEAFVSKTKSFKDATRIYRDGGSERCWQTLKPKIIMEWEERSLEEEANSAAGTPAPVDRPMLAQGNNGVRNDNTSRSATNTQSQPQASQAAPSFASGPQTSPPNQQNYHTMQAHTHLLQQQQQRHRQMQSLQSPQIQIQQQQHRQQQENYQARLFRHGMHVTPGYSVAPHRLQSYDMSTYGSSMSSRSSTAGHTSVSYMPSTSYPLNPSYQPPSFSNNTTHQAPPPTWARAQSSSNFYQDPHNNLHHNNLHHSETSKMAISSLLSDNNNNNNNDRRGF